MPRRCPPTAVRLWRVSAVLMARLMRCRHHGSGGGVAGGRTDITGTRGD